MERSRVPRASGVASGMSIETSEAFGRATSRPSASPVSRSAVSLGRCGRCPQHHVLAVLDAGQRLEEDDMLALGEKASAEHEDAPEEELGTGELGGPG
jgi:hypothetical protein